MTASKVIIYHIGSFDDDVSDIKKIRIFSNYKTWYTRQWLWNPLYSVLVGVKTTVVALVLWDPVPDMGHLSSIWRENQASMGVQRSQSGGR